MPTREQLESALRNADKAGDREAAKALANALKAGEFDREKPKGTAVDAVLEPAKAIAGGAFREAAAGLYGIGNLHRGPMEAAAAVEQKRQDIGDFAPKTQTGQRGLENVGKVADLATKAVRYPASGLAAIGTHIATGDPLQAAETQRRVMQEGIGEVAGEATLEATGSPLRATAARIAPDVAGAVAGMTGVRQLMKKSLIDMNTGELSAPFRKALQDKGVTSSNLTARDIALLPDSDPQTAATALIRNKLEQGAGDEYLAPYRLEGKGPWREIKPDDLAMEAEKQGIPRGAIMAIKNADPATRKEMLKMLKMHRSIKSNMALAEQFRHTDVIGDSGMSRFNYVRGVANKDRIELNRVADGLKGVPVNTAKIRIAFVDALDDLGVKYDDPNFPQQFDFVGSEISKNPAAKKFIKDVRDLLAEPVMPDAARAHSLKRQLDELIDWNKKTKGGLSESGRNVAKRMRHELNQVIREVSPEYGAVNDRLSSAIKAMNDFDDSMGRKVDVFGDNAETMVGTKMRNLLNNMETRGNMETAIDQLYKAAEQLGGQFKDDTRRLVTFGKILDDRFKPVSASGSFQGEITTAVGQNYRDIADAARGNMMGVAMKKAIEKMEQVRGVNDDNAYRVIENMLKRDLTSTSTALQRSK